MNNMLFSIITPIYKTPIYKLERLYKSLCIQTYSKWEWIVYDDSPQDYFESFTYIHNLYDNRIKLYRGEKHEGVIGKVKKKAFFLASGDVLVEVDHDDELVDTCLENLYTAYNYSSDIGFVYGHACELYEDGGGFIDYGNNWAFGYGGYGVTDYKDKIFNVAMVSNINAKTIRHITGVPNHVRSWRSEVYKKIGGHNDKLHIADDFELIIRTFLETKMAKIDAFTYIQYFDGTQGNTQFIKNKDIHVLVPIITDLFNDDIHKRFIEMGVDDYIWKNGEIDFNEPNRNPESFANIIIPKELLKNSLIASPLVDPTKIYGYSRVYDIQSVLKYKKTEHYSNFIKWLVKLTNCNSYLELGVESGTNILNIKDEVDVCVGVDINPIDLSNNDNIQFYQMTTDIFFWFNERHFDIIFIDANHEYEQVKKDFNNSLDILNKFGIIIIHDTDPIVRELLSEKHCHNSYNIIDYIENNPYLNIINLPIQETGLTLVMRKSDRRIFEFMKK